MRVHLGQAGHQVAAFAVDARGAGRNLNGGGRPHFGDAIAGHDHRLPFQDALFIHREHVYMFEGIDAGVLRVHGHAYFSMASEQK